MWERYGCAVGIGKGEEYEGLAGTHDLGYGIADMMGGAFPDQGFVLCHYGVHEFQGLREKVLVVNLAGYGQPEPQVVAEKDRKSVV